MAVFRVEKNKGYTVMSNHHLRNQSLSLKAKGLLSQMLSLPDDWDYTLLGLSAINLEKVDAIRTAIKELEQAGYIKRRQLRDEKGRLTNTLYTIYEKPVETSIADDENAENQHSSPLLDFPTSDKPITDNPTSDNPTQRNKDELNKELINKESINPILSSFQNTEKKAKKNLMGCDKDSMEDFNKYKKIIKENINYFYLENEFGKDQAAETLQLIIETVCSNKKTIRISGEEIPKEYVKEKFLSLTRSHILYVYECLDKKTVYVRNIKQYMLAALFNAPTTIDSYYTALVKHDMANGLI